MLLSVEYIYSLVPTALERTISSLPSDVASDDGVHARPANNLKLVRHVTVPYYHNPAVDSPEATNGVNASNVGNPDGINGTVTKVEPEQETEEARSQTGIEESQSCKVSFVVLYTCFFNNFLHRIHQDPMTNQSTIALHRKVATVQKLAKRRLY